MENIRCNICGKEYSYAAYLTGKFGQHLKKVHNMSSKEYYDLFFKQENEGVCPICGKETAFQNISKGYSKHCCCKCSAIDQDTRQKYIDTCINILGTTNYFNSAEWKEKSKEIESNRTLEDKARIKLTREETCLKRYGVKNTYQSPEIMGKVDKTKLYNKASETKRKNNTFHTSKPENKVYEMLTKVYTNVIRNYRSSAYPFACDFYIPSLDLYIECNFHWTHGRHWFNKTSEDDLAILNKWREKVKQSKYYKIAIDVWTNRDINKKLAAEKNKLNYVVFWNMQDAIDFLEGKI